LDNRANYEPTMGVPFVAQKICREFRYGNNARSGIAKFVLISLKTQAYYSHSSITCATFACEFRWDRATHPGEGEWPFFRGHAAQLPTAGQDAPPAGPNYKEPDLRSTALRAGLDMTPSPHAARARPALGASVAADSGRSAASENSFHQYVCIENALTQMSPLPHPTKHTDGASRGPGLRSCFKTSSARAQSLD